MNKIKILIFILFSLCFFNFSFAACNTEEEACKANTNNLESFLEKTNENKIPQENIKENNNIIQENDSYKKQENPTFEKPIYFIFWIFVLIVLYFYLKEKKKKKKKKND